MAKNNSFITLEGTLNGLTFYRKDGENLVKTQSRVSKDRIMTDAAFRRTRENMQEFGGAAKAGKAFRDSFAAVLRIMSDTYMGARVNGLIKRINRLGAGPRGERAIDVTAYSSLLEQFEFNTSTPLSAQFYAPSGLPVINGTRDKIEWSVPDFDTDSYIRKPEGATHFRLLLAGGYTSDYAFDLFTGGYLPVDAAVNGRGDVAYSAPIALNGMVGSATDLAVDFTSLGTIPVTSALFGCVGIIFYQEINSVLYELAQGNAMKVVVSG